MTATTDLQNKQARPLTHLSKQGVAYQRPPEVEEQIAAALHWTAAQLQAGAGRQALEPLRAEALVYFIRQARRDGDAPLAEALAVALTERAMPQIRRHIRAFVRYEDTEDAVQDVITDIFELIVSGNSPASDYAEVRWADFVHKTAVRFSLRYGRQARRFVATTDDENAPETPAPLTLQPAEKVDLLRGLSRLPEPGRTAFVWYHRDGVKITSNDPATPTIAQYFGVSEKTVRNWLRRAEKLLREWRGEADE